MDNNTSQNFESFLPVYDVVPDKWEDAGPFFVEILKKISNAVNLREIGWVIQDQVLTGKAFEPGANPDPKNTPYQYRQIFRKMVIFPTGLTAGINSIAHGIVFDINFTLVDMWVAATDTATTTAEVITGTNVIMGVTFITVMSPQNFSRAEIIIEYLLEV